MRKIDYSFEYFFMLYNHSFDNIFNMSPFISTYKQSTRIKSLKYEDASLMRDDFE